MAISEYWLRYYSPAFEERVRETIGPLLGEVRNTHQVRCEKVPLRLAPSRLNGALFPDDTHEGEIYKRDFPPRKNLLKTRTGLPMHSALRSRSGGYFVAGTVAIVSDLGIEWYSTAGERFSQYDPDHRIGFLKALLAEGPKLLAALCPLVRSGNPEAELLDAFLSHRILAGTVRREVPLGAHRFSTEVGTFDYRKAADLVIDAAEQSWVIEVKTALSYHALGQVLVYGDLFEEEFPGNNVRLGIVCGSIDAEILRACIRRGISVFEVGEEGVRLFIAPLPQS
jgi:hypothetical protein